MILITESYYDRYHLPLIVSAISLFSFIPVTHKLSLPVSKGILVLMAYISIAGTRDYLELNRKRWAAYYYLKDEQKADVKKINGGFEINCWNEGKRSFWYEFLSLNNYDYLIQFRQEKEFKKQKAYIFQRYFPYRQDTLFIYAREHKQP